MRLLFIFALLVGALAAQCDQAFQDYGACVLKCDSQFSEAYQVYEKEDCLRQNCASSLNASLDCNEKGFVSQNVVVVASQKAVDKADETNFQTATAKDGGNGLLGLIVFLALLGIAMLAYFKLLRKK